MNKLRSFTIKHFDVVRLLVAVLISVALGILLIVLVSKEPWTAVQKLFLGPLQSARRFGNVIELMIPLTFAGLSITVMFTANQFNLGTEGSFYAGAAIAGIVALTVGLPAGLHPIFAILVGGIVGALICGISGVLKVAFGTSELVSSLMLNYVFFYLFKYFAFTYFKDPKSGFESTYKLPGTVKLPLLFEGTRVHLGLIIMLVTVVLVWLYMKKTTWGYRLKLVGENRIFAEYSGIGVSMVVLSSQLIGGFLGGMGGAVEVLGMYERFQWVQLAGYGFDGVIVAILARRNPAFVPVAAFFLAYLRIGSDVMSGATDVTTELVAIIQSVIILFVSAKVFLEGYRQKLVVKEVTEHE